MKELIKAYAIRAHEASRACDNYACAAGYKLGHTDSARHLRNNERDKHMEVMRFPANIPLIPVVIFAIGVTWRLMVSLLCAAVLRASTFVLDKHENSPKK